MWKVGDKCQVITADNIVIPDCEIVDISFDTELVQVKTAKCAVPGLFSLEEIICNNFYNDLGIDYCALVGDEKPMCAYCPRLDNSFSNEWFE